MQGRPQRCLPSALHRVRVDGGGRLADAIRADAHAAVPDRALPGHGAVPVKVVVTGGRDYADQAAVFAFLDAIHAETPITLLIHGACGWDADVPREHTALRLRGADRWADRWARSRGVSVLPIPARWKAGGGHAGPVRNGWMLDRMPDLVVAFPGGAGTANCVRQAQVRGMPIRRGATE